MDKVKPLEDLPHDKSRYILGYILGIPINYISQTATIHVLDQHEQAIHVVIRLQIVDDVFICTHGHDCGLYFYLVEHLFVGDLHHSDCHALVRSFPVVCLVDSAHGALAELLGKTIDFVRVA